MNEPFAAVLLAGGKSRRMGRDKALLPLADGRPLWQRQLDDVLRPLGPAELLVSGPAREGFPSDAKCIADAAPGLGPLGGVAAALDAAKSPWLLVLAVDLPGMTAAYLELLLNDRTPGAGVVPVHPEGWLEPLAAIYPRACLPLAEARLSGPDRSMHGFVREALSQGLFKTRPILPSETILFANWNAPPDWTKTFHARRCGLVSVVFSHGITPVKSSRPTVLAVNGGSSSIKFALFEAGEPFARIFKGQTEAAGADEVAALMDSLEKRIDGRPLAAVGHRLVHGGPKYWTPQPVTPELIAGLRELSPLDPEHLPAELMLLEALMHRFPDVPQIACFDTAFHHEMPRIAQILPIPRRYLDEGVRRYGFHGISCSYLIEELAKLAGEPAAKGRVILAHLGSGASITAVREGKSIDTSMGFTPAAGIPMSRRSGDLDPGLGPYLARTEKMTAEEFGRMANHESGLLGLSGISPDMRELLKRESESVPAAEAVELFCYQARKFIGAYAAALGGLDTVVFAGGIGERSATVRSRICAGLGFLGIHMEESRNAVHAPIISADGSQVTVRVIPTDEELMIARSVCRTLH